MLIRKILLMLVGMAAMIVAPGVAAAQEPFAPETLSAPTLTEAHRGQIQAFVDEVLAGLQAGEPVSIMTARRIAQRELTRPQVRVPFRMDFAAIATPELTPLTRDQNDLVAINALYILGDIAASESTLALLDSLKDEREAVRYAAIVALEKSFTAPNAVLPRRDIDVVQRQLSVQLAAEDSPKVTAAYVRTLSSATHPGRVTVPDMRNVAISQLGTTFADRVAKAAEAQGPADPAMVDAMLQAADALRGGFMPGRSINDEQARQSARLAGMLLAYARDRLQEGNVGAYDSPEAARTERQNIQTLVQLGEGIVVFSGTTLGKSISPTGLPDLIEQAQDQRFIDGVMDVIGPEGVLTSSPFDFPDDEFVKD